jgi:hypothetical protein
MKSSFEFSAVRFFTSAASHGWYGKPPGRPSPKLMPLIPIGSSGPQTSDSGSCARPHIVSAVSQMPENSGLPSGLRGAGAARLGLPSAVRGTPAVGYFSHWPNTVGDSTTRTVIATTRRAERTMKVRIRPSDPFPRGVARIPA